MKIIPSVVVFALIGVSEALQRHTLQSINLWRLRQQRALAQTPHNQLGFSIEDQFDDEFPPQTFTQPRDHWDPSSPTFEQRYWVNKRHYTPGGPVIVIDAGETSGRNRLSFLDTGIADILARETNGLGVVLEHRYYGKSVPVDDLSTDSMRWLTYAQALEDSANFMANVNFTGIAEDLTAPNTPWIYYGGSYAGARAAHMRKLYPDLVYGAIASSAVTHAVIDNWEYMEIIRLAAPQLCSERVQKTMKTVDNLVRNRFFKRPLKALFGLSGLDYDDDFLSVVSEPLGAFQDKNWDPNEGSSDFDAFCEALGGEEEDAVPLSLHPDELEEGFEEANLPDLPIDLTLIKYSQYIRTQVASQCPEVHRQNECFGTHDLDQYHKTSLNETWRLWVFQTCIEWGYFIGPPPDPEWPSLLSRLVDFTYESKICQMAFPPGEHFQIPTWPNVSVVNSLGDFNLAADRLAFIDGEIDPWRPCTPHSRWALPRNDTTLRPFKIIPRGVHHYDENGLVEIVDEPAEIQQIHLEEIQFVKAWLRDWKKPKP